MWWDDIPVATAKPKSKTNWWDEIPLAGETKPDQQLTSRAMSMQASGAEQRVAKVNRIASELANWAPSSGGSKWAAQQIPREDRDAFLDALAREAGKRKRASSMGFLGRAGLGVLQALEAKGGQIRSWAGRGPDKDTSRFMRQIHSVWSSSDPTRNPEASWTDPREWVVDVGRMAPDIYMAGATGGVAGGAARALGAGAKVAGVAAGISSAATFAPGMYDETYDALLSDGVAPSTARWAATTSATLQSLLYAGIPARLKPKGAAADFTKNLGREIAKRYAKTAVIHGPGLMAGAQAVDMAVQDVAKGESSGFSQYAKNVTSTYLHAVGPMAIMAAPTAAVEATRLQVRTRAEKQAARDAARVKAWQEGQKAQKPPALAPPVVQQKPPAPEKAPALPDVQISGGKVEGVSGADVAEESAKYFAQGEPHAGGIKERETGHGNRPAPPREVTREEQRVDQDVTGATTRVRGHEGEGVAGKEVGAEAEVGKLPDEDAARVGPQRAAQVGPPGLQEAITIAERKVAAGEIPSFWKQEIENARTDMAAGRKVSSAYDKLIGQFGPQAEGFGKQARQGPGIAQTVPLSTGKLMQSVGGFFKRFFTAAGELPQDVYEAKVRKDSEAAREMTKLGFLAGDFRKAISQALGGRELTQADLARMNAVLRGEAEPATVPEALRSPLQAMRDHIDSLSRRLISEGVAQGELVGIIEQNLGVYATRSYRVFDDPKWREHVPPAVRNRAIAWLRSEFPDKSDAEIQGLVESLLFKGVEAGSPVALLKGSKLGSKDLGILMKRKEIPEPLRELWGEYRDAGVNYARSVFKMAHLLANQRFLNQVRESGMGRFLAEEPIVDQRGELIAKIAADKSSVMSPLNGLYTTPEIKRAFEEINRPEALPDWLRMYMAINSTVKYSKTVLSVMTHVRNMLSNTGFAIANGHWRIGNAKDAWTATLTGLIGMSDAGWRERHLRLVELGLVGEDVRAGELKDALRDAAKMDIDEFIYNTEARQAKKIVGAGRKAARAVTALYQAEDAIWKVYAFENEKARYQKAHPDWTVDQTEIRAAEIVRDTYPTYSKLGAGIKALRRFPLIGPFVSFNAEVIRTTFNTLRIGAQEMQAPETRGIGASRWTGTLMALAGMSGASWATMALVGMRKRDDEDLRWFVPPWQKNSRFLYTKRKPDGKVSLVDMGYSDPHAQITDPVVSYMRGENFQESVAKAAGEFARPFISEEILTKAIREVVSNTTDSGRPVYNPQDTASQQTASIVAHIWEALEPGTLTSGRRIYKGITGEVSETGRSYDPATEIAAISTGQRIQDIDVEQSLGFLVSRFDRDLYKIESIVRKSLTSRGTVTGEQVASDRQRMEQLRKKAFSQMQQILGAARRLGVPDEKIKAILKDARLSQAVVNQLLSGSYVQYKMSTATEQRMQQLGPDQFGARMSGTNVELLPGPRQKPGVRRRTVKRR